MWNETWKRVNRFLPNFFAELFPEEAGKPKKSKEVLPVREKEKDNDKDKENEKDKEKEGDKEVVEAEKVEGEVEEKKEG
jgi:brefeldin A-resistance guanine nucleotide exchange factor 1